MTEQETVELYLKSIILVMTFMAASGLTAKDQNSAGIWDLDIHAVTELFYRTII